ncbi:TIGR01777 family oxidoreductase [Foetidibacter luteolus]|uniref:TIGR01777 family oxidoreductase n=1 Tax=Foetidibacter luteolus TaxID=2608880 RepID=UPI00129A0BCC|nr:TIGR01777 family oxidoreductase [Foetidibacter luteolus]
MQNLKIVIAGGTGFIGRELASFFGANNQVVILSRSLPSAANNGFSSFKANDDGYKNVRLVKWNPAIQGDWIREIDGCSLVINLAGKSVNCRYNKSNKQEIFDSRTVTTEAIGEAIRKATIPPKLWINAASATIYRHATDRAQDEFTGEYHNDFSVQVCKRWEGTFFNQRTPFTRKVALRMAITLGSGGVMVPYLNLCRFGLGGRQGSGQQMFSWVHIQDVCRVIEFMWAKNELEGVFNVSAPNPVANTHFMGALRKATGHTFGLPAYEWMLKAGAFFLGTEPELVLKSRWVLPAKLLQQGFVFKYPMLEDAFAEIVPTFKRTQYHLF